MNSYEQKYKEALEVAKRKLCFDKAGMVDSFTPNDIYEIFPELKESDDERIRKALITAVLGTFKGKTLWHTDVTREEALAWLKKQGEQKLDGTFVNVDDVREDFVNEVYRVLDADSTNDRANQIIDAFDNLPTVTIKQDPCEHCKMTYSTCYSFPCDEKKAFEQGKTALEAINEEKVDNANKVEPKFKVKYAGNEYNVLDVKHTSGVTYYGIEDEPNHIDYVKAENCDIISGYGIKESGCPYPTKSVTFSEQKQEEKTRYNIGDVICDKSCTTLNKDAQPNMEIVDIKKGMYICDKGSFPVSQQDEYELVSKKIDTKLNDDSVSNELRAASFAHARREIVSHTFPNNEEFELAYTFEEGAKWNAAQKPAWSEEDEEILDLIIARLQSHADVDLEEYSKEYDWLNSPEVRSAWKPSDEQMDALEYHLKHTNENSRLYKETKKLYDQLKKLK